MVHVLHAAKNIKALVLVLRPNSLTPLVLVSSYTFLAHCFA